MDNNNSNNIKIDHNINDIILPNLPNINAIKSPSIPINNNNNNNTSFPIPMNIDNNNDGSPFIDSMSDVLDNKTAARTYIKRKKRKKKSSRCAALDYLSDSPKKKRGRKAKKKKNMPPIQKQPFFLVFPDLRLKCPQCDHIAICQGTLVQHLRKHPNSRKCPVCKKIFSTQQNLIKHARLHTGERPYPCPIYACKWAYKQKGDLLAHIQRGKHGVSSDNNRKPPSSKFYHGSSKLPKLIPISQQDARDAPDLKTLIIGLRKREEAKKKQKEKVKNKRKSQLDDFVLSLMLSIYDISNNDMKSLLNVASKKYNEKQLKKTQFMYNNNNNNNNNSVVMNKSSTVSNDEDDIEIDEDNILFAKSRNSSNSLGQFAGKQRSNIKFNYLVNRVYGDYSIVLVPLNSIPQEEIHETTPEIVINPDLIPELNNKVKVYDLSPQINYLGNIGSAPPNKKLKLNNGTNIRLYNNNNMKELNDNHIVLSTTHNNNRLKHSITHSARKRSYHKYNQTAGGFWQCDAPNCGSLFITKDELGHHCLQYHDAGYYGCKYCERIYRSQKNVQNHLKKSHQKNPDLYLNALHYNLLNRVFEIKESVWNKIKSNPLNGIDLIKKEKCMNQLEEQKENKKQTINTNDNNNNNKDNIQNKEEKDDNKTDNNSNNNNYCNIKDENDDITDNKSNQDNNDNKGTSNIKDNSPNSFVKHLIDLNLDPNNNFNSNGLKSNSFPSFIGSIKTVKIDGESGDGDGDKKLLKSIIIKTHPIDANILRELHEDEVNINNPKPNKSIKLVPWIQQEKQKKIGIKGRGRPRLYNIETIDPNIDDNNIKIKGRGRGRPRGSRGRGRPKGSKNRVGDQNTSNVRRPRGRPKGSKNKPKINSFLQATRGTLMPSFINPMQQPNGPLTPAIIATQPNDIKSIITSISTPRPRGRPKGSKTKKTNVSDESQQHNSKQKQKKDRRKRKKRRNRVRSRSSNRNRSNDNDEYSSLSNSEISMAEVGSSNSIPDENINTNSIDNMSNMIIDNIADDIDDTVNDKLDDHEFSSVNDERSIIQRDLQRWHRDKKKRKRVRGRKRKRSGEYVHDSDDEKTIYDGDNDEDDDENDDDDNGDVDDDIDIEHKSVKTENTIQSIQEPVELIKVKQEIDRIPTVSSSPTSSRSGRIITKKYNENLNLTQLPAFNIGTGIAPLKPMNSNNNLRHPNGEFINSMVQMNLQHQLHDNMRQQQQISNINNFDISSLQNILPSSTVNNDLLNNQLFNDLMTVITSQSNNSSNNNNNHNNNALQLPTNGYNNNPLNMLSNNPLISNNFLPNLNNLNNFGLTPTSPTRTRTRTQLQQPTKIKKNINNTPNTSTTSSQEPIIHKTHINKSYLNNNNNNFNNRPHAPHIPLPNVINNYGDIVNNNFQTTLPNSKHPINMLGNLRSINNFPHLNNLNNMNNINQLQNINSMIKLNNNNINSAHSSNNSSDVPDLVDVEICAAKGCNKSERDDGSILLLCGRCFIVRYCSKQCQVSDHSRHKAACKRSVSKNKKDKKPKKQRI